MSSAGAVTALDCVTCGACCSSTDPSYIELFAIDRRRLDERAAALTVSRDGRCFMRFEAGRCAALRLQDGRTLCAIYEQRPDACRWLEPGSGECLDQRMHKLDPGLLSVEKLRRRPPR